MEKTLVYVTNSYEGSHREKLMHALELMLMMNTDEEKEAALLKDILSVKTVEELKSDGISETLINSILSMNRKPRESQAKFMKRVSENELASMVMHADLITFLVNEDDGKKLTAAKTKELNQAKTFYQFLRSENRQEKGDRDGE